MPRTVYEQVVVGEWFAPTKKHREMCCNCGLVHVLEYRTNQGQIEIRVLEVKKARVRKAAVGGLLKRAYK